jgi:tRNA1Val (adenine37-N6)-methyltransferase
VLQANLREITTCLAPETFSQVVCNPPFYRQGSGRQSASQEALHARHQILADLGDFVRAAAYVLKNGGVLAMIYPAAGVTEMAACFSANGLEMKRLRFVYSYPDPAENARLVLVQAVKKAGPGVRVMPPMYIYAEKRGCYSPEMELLYQEQLLPDAAVRPVAAVEAK